MIGHGSDGYVVELNGVMLCKAEVENNDYEPYHEPITTNIYLNQPLRKIDEYSDYIDLLNKTVVRNINVSEINFINSKLETEDYTEKETICFYNRETITDGKKLSDSAKKYVMSPSLNGVSRNSLTGNDIEGIALDDTATTKTIILIRLNKKLIDEYEHVNKYLKDNKIKVHYILEKQITEQIDIPNFITYEGKNIISIDTKVQPSDIDIEYYKINK